MSFKILNCTVTSKAKTISSKDSTIHSTNNVPCEPSSAEWYMEEEEEELGSNKTLKAGKQLLFEL